MVRRVGGTKARRIDVRFVSATNRNPEEQILEGKFRRDLFFRINGVQLPVPPLRQRLSEIEPLARLFLQEFCEKSAVPLPELTPEAVLALRDYSWPGNVRELKNVMERVVFMCGAGPILAKHIPRNQMSSLVPDLGAEEFLDVTAVFTPSSQANSYEEGDDERDRIIRALEACGGNQTRAARLLGVSRRTLVNRLESYNLPRPRKA
jgi:two-component system response regulator AtoC